MSQAPPAGAAQCPTVKRGCFLSNPPGVHSEGDPLTAARGFGPGAVPDRLSAGWGSPPAGGTADEECGSAVRTGRCRRWPHAQEPQPGFLPFRSFSVVQADERPAGGALETPDRGWPQVRLPDLQSPGQNEDAGCLGRIHAGFLDAESRPLKRTRGPFARGASGDGTGRTRGGGPGCWVPAGRWLGRSPAPCRTRGTEAGRRGGQGWARTAGCPPEGRGLGADFTPFWKLKQRA